MKSPCTGVIFVALLPVLVLSQTGCHRKTPAPVPQASTAPPLPPSSMTQLPTVPKLPAPAQPQVGPPGSDQKVQETPPVPPKHIKHSKKHPAGTDTATAVSPPTPPVVAPPAVAVVPEPSLGQLSAGAGADSHERAVMTDQIHTQEVRLSKLKHPLNDEDEAITKEVEVFLGKAKQAVDENDLDGAQTLTTKAKVLLDELTKS